MVLVMEGHGAEHRPEDFLPGQPMLGRHVAQQGGGLVEAAVGRLLHDLALRHHGNAGHLGI
jgi:hypothetical protein